MPTDTVDVEAGFPLAAPIDDAVGGVGGGHLACSAPLEAVHVGPYDTLPATYQENAVAVAGGRPVAVS